MDLGRKKVLPLPSLASSLKQTPERHRVGYLEGANPTFLQEVLKAGAARVGKGTIIYLCLLKRGSFAQPLRSIPVGTFPWGRSSGPGMTSGAFLQLQPPALVGAAAPQQGIVHRASAVQLHTKP